MSIFQPPLFVSHGAPDLVLADIPAARFLRTLFKERPHPEGIVIVSAHWQSRELAVTTSSKLGTIYDFSRFARDLYEISYPAKSSAWLGAKIKDQIKGADLTLREDQRRGLDHGAWAPLCLMFPDASIPIVQLSLKRGMSAVELFELGQQFSPLADENILIMGSGASVHNLWSLGREGSKAPQWAEGFEAWTNKVLNNRDWRALCRFNEAEFWAQAHPTPEHFLPLIFSAGAGQLQSKGVIARRLHHSFSYGSIGMSSWEFAHAT